MFTVMIWRISRRTIKLIKPSFGSILFCAGELPDFFSRQEPSCESSLPCIWESFSCEITAWDDPGARCLLNDDESKSRYYCIAV